MSSNAENGPANPSRAGRRTSSSTLLSAFQRLTSRSQPSADQNLTTSPSVAVSQNGTISTRSATRLDTENGTSLAEVPEPSTSGQPRAFQVVGGPSELKELVSKLEPSQPMQLRLAAAGELVAMLHRYPVKDVLPIWIAGGRFSEAAR